MRKLMLMVGWVLIACAWPAQAQTVFTFSNWTGPGQTKAVQEWCALLEKNAAGKMKCNILPRPVAGPGGTFDAVANGVADISVFAHGTTAGRFVLTQIAEFPLLGDSAEAASVAFTRVAARHPEFQKEHQGVHVLGYFTHGPGMVFNTKKPILKAEDFDGLKLKSNGGICIELAKALKINATFKPAPEAYELIAGGVLDGTLWPAESIVAYKLETILKYATSFPGGLYNASWVLIMNPDRYAKLTPEEKKIVDSVSGEVPARVFGRQWDALDRTALAAFGPAGVKLTRADASFVADLKAKAVPLEQQWAAKAETRGLKEPLKVLDEYRKEIANVLK